MSSVSEPRSFFPVYTLKVPVDHFHNDSMYAPHSNETFNLRYWLDTTYYKPGGPVIVLAGGETSGADRIPFMQKGILAILAKATNGLSVILEHRYYGESKLFPDYSTETLRFLTTHQALADTAYFAENVQFPLTWLEGSGAGKPDLHPSKTPWILYGGSYAGGFVAFARKLYPDLFWGAIASSGVTAAISDYWSYFEAHRLFGPRECVNTTQALLDVVDGIVLDRPDSADVDTLKDLFGLANLTHVEDFVAAIADGVGGWQSRNWDPAVSGKGYERFCAALVNKTLGYPEMEAHRSTAEALFRAAGQDCLIPQFTTHFLNWAGWSRATHKCAAPNTQDQCFGLNEADFWTDTSTEERLWFYQVCTQWGYFQAADTTPEDIRPVVSRALTLEWTKLPCRLAFDLPGEPDVEAINQWGGLDISYPRLAFVDGEADPWRSATPHAIGARDRESTASEPFILIPGAVHHWDENGLFDNETTADLPPKAVKGAQDAEVTFVKVWLSEWQSAKERPKGSRMQAPL
jgi:hypothetical protein